MSRGLKSFAGYLPTTRLSRAAIAEANAWANPNLKAGAAGSRSTAHWDEDAVTMAVEAGTRCLAAVDHTTSSVVLASTRLPFADRQNAAIVRLAVGLPDDVHTMDVCGGQRAGLSALLTALTHQGENQLVIASNMSVTKPASPAELSYGDGAAAFLVGSTGGMLAEYVSHSSLADDLVDHYRETGNDYDYILEDRWVRDEGHMKLVPRAVGDVLQRAGVAVADIAHFVMQAPNATLEKKLAGKLGIDPVACHGGLAAGCGYTGAAYPLMALVEVLEKAKPGELILLVGFGQGVDALLLKAGTALAGYTPSASLTHQRGNGTLSENYMKFLSFRDQIALDWGMRAERDERTAQSVAYRKSRDIYAFEGGKCGVCGTQQFPMSNVCINPNCREMNTQTPFSFRGVPGRVKTFTEDWQAYSPCPPLIYGNIEFEGGGNLLMEIADCAEGQIGVGSTVKTVFRIKDIDRRRGFRRYFWKSVPSESAEGE